MLRPTVIRVKPKENYMLELEFDNHEIKEFDVKPYIKGTWYSQLADFAYFCSVKTDGYTVVWESGQDICPDELYELSKPLKRSEA